MNKLSRRSFFKGIGSLAALAQLGRFPAWALKGTPTTCSSKELIRLNVFLHGTFACIYDTTKPTGDVQVIMPDVGPDHIYMAGDVDPNSGQPLVAGAAYGTTGITGVLMDPLPSNLVVIENSKTPINIDPGSKTFCSITLPRPDSIWALKCRTQVDAGSGNKIPWFSTYPYDQQPDALPLILALSYSTFSGCPTFGVTGQAPLWTAAPRGNGGGSLHIRMELAPGHCPPPMANHFSALLDLLPPLGNQLILNNVGKEQPFTTNTPPLSVQGEDQALLQILQNVKGVGPHKHDAEKSNRKAASPMQSCPRTDQVSTCQSIVIQRP